jgi:3-oxoacyl-[acyl-carrier-protein] synthase-1
MNVRSTCRLSAMGMINALGAGSREIWPRLLASDRGGFTRRDDLVPACSLLVAPVTTDLPAIPDHLRRYACRNNALALAALTQIAREIAAAVDRFGPARVAVVVGTSTSGVADAEIAIGHQLRTGRLAEAFDYAQLEFGGAAGFVADWAGVSGPAYTLSTACSSGARALASARSLLALGLCDAVVAGATDSLCGLTTNGFTSLRALSDEPTNPCSANRNGLTLGEGAVMFLVTRDRGGVQLVGVGESSEAHHMSAPDPEGRGAERAMLGALRDAGADPTEMLYLNLHGTGTPLNDSMECAAVERVVGTGVPCSSTKPLVGHTLGAAGAMEAGFCWLMLVHRDGDDLALPPHAWDGVRDPALAPVHLVEVGERVRASGRAAVMTNSFGFGGNNCTLILAEDEA